MTTVPKDGQNGLDLAAWTIEHSDWTETLVIAVQMNYLDMVVFSPIGVDGRIKEVLFGNVKMVDNAIEFSMGRTSTAAIIVESRKSEDASGVLGRAVHALAPTLCTWTQA